MGYKTFPKQTFLDTKRLNPYWSSWICFCEVIKGKDLTSRVVKRYFEELVDKVDYTKADKWYLTQYLLGLRKS